MSDTYMSIELVNSRPDDRELLRDTARGDHRSLAELHERYSGVLMATAFRVLNNIKDAEEVVQEAFVQIWEKASVYDSSRGKPLTWAMTLTRNKAIDRLRRVQRRNRLHADIEQEAQIWDRIAETDSSDEAVAHETQAMVRSAVIQLSDAQRRAIELAFFGGLTQNEIAEQLSEPLGTVKARIRRGMMKLRQIIGPNL
ncbi:MAG: sigma-70 family RNA polymerase sigma factor [Chthoniobacterales bacterium]|nr:sigma-70 family RNA polymerase sigma factor [Chthoniobacterales bacterium]